MAARDDPRDAVVSIWRREPNEFLGSGSFIGANLVLTAKHVLRLVDRKQEIASPGLLKFAWWRSACRTRLAPGTRHGPYGFRLALGQVAS